MFDGEPDLGRRSKEIVRCDLGVLIGSAGRRQEHGSFGASQVGAFTRAIAACRDERAQIELVQFALTFALQACDILDTEPYATAYQRIPIVCRALASHPREAADLAERTKALHVTS